MRFAVPNIGLALALTAIMSIDLLFVKGIIPDDAIAGIYAAAQNAARLTYFVIIPAGIVLFPAMAEAMASGDHARQRILVGDGIEGAVAVVLVTRRGDDRRPGAAARPALRAARTRARRPRSSCSRPRSAASRWPTRWRRC